MNNQEYITSELEKTLYKILPISVKRLKNLVAIIIGILLCKSVVISEISQKLKDNFSEGNNRINYLKDIKPLKKKVKKFNEVLLSRKEYKCNLAVCKAEDSEDTWYLATNMNSKQAVNEYKKRFDIEEMFRDLKSNGFNMEDTWTEGIVYFENLYLCLSIAYTWMIVFRS